MLKKIDRIFTLVVFLVLAGFLIFRQKKIQETLVDSQHQESVEQNGTAVDSNSLEFAVVDPTIQTARESYTFIATVSGQSALELAKSEAQLSLKEYDFGVMIEGVDNLMADNEHYWALYQNDNYATTGIADIKLQANDKLELKYEEIQI
jgi:hypothetical protein